MKLLVVGATGQVGQATAAFGIEREYEVVGLGSKELDITQSEQVKQVIGEHQPDFVINCAAYTAVDKAEDDREACLRINTDGPANLASACSELDIPLIHLSTDYVFDGEKTAAYKETDDVKPLGVYGESKWQGEELVRQLCPNHIILRISWVFGPFGHNFMKTMLRLGAERQELSVVADQYGAPTYTGDIARVVVAIAEQLHCQVSDDLWGTYHYCGTDVTTWHRFAKVIFMEAKGFVDLQVDQVHEITTDEYPTPVTRPKNSALDCHKILYAFGIKQRPWRSGIMATLKHLYQPPVEVESTESISGASE